MLLLTHAHLSACCDASPFLFHSEVHAVRNILGDHGNPINDPMFKINMGVTAMGTLSIAEGATPLHVAAYHGRHQLVAWLVKQGADVSARDGMHMTPAEVTQSKRVIKELENSRRLRKSYAKMRKDQGVDARLDALEAMARQGGFDRSTVVLGNVVAFLPLPACLVCSRWSFWCCAGRKKGAVDLSEIEIMVDDLRLELETHCDDSGVKFSTVDQRLDELQHALAQQASLNLNDIYSMAAAPPRFTPSAVLTDLTPARCVTS